MIATIGNDGTVYKIETSAKEYAATLNSQYNDKVSKLKASGVDPELIIQSTVRACVEIDTENPEQTLYNKLNYELLIFMQAMKFIKANAPIEQIKMVMDKFEEERERFRKETSPLSNKTAEMEVKIKTMEEQVENVEREASEYINKEIELNEQIKNCGFFQRNQKKELISELEQLHKSPCPSADDLKNKLDNTKSLYPWFKSANDKNLDYLKELAIKSQELISIFAKLIAPPTQGLDVAMDNMMSSARHR